MSDELKEILELIDTGRTHEARNRLAQIISAPQRYDIDADPNGIRADVTRCVRAAMYCGANNVNPPPEGNWLREFWLIGRAETSRQDDLAAQQRASVDKAMVERIAALLHEEATGEPWTVAGVEHPGPDRDYYRGLARKVAALTQQPAAPSAEPPYEIDALFDALSNLEHDNYERSYSGSKNREADAGLIRAALERYAALAAEQQGGVE